MRKTSYKLKTPLTLEKMKRLRVGDRVRISGIIYTARDASHKRIVKILKKGGKLPIPLMNQIIYYTGPTPTRPGRIIGSCGPTTSSRMDPYTIPLLKKGLRGMIGKGRRSKKIMEAIKGYQAVYFTAPGGCGALLRQYIKKAEVIAYRDLGPEAIYRLEVEDFPVIVAIDSRGKNLYRKGGIKMRKGLIRRSLFFLLMLMLSISLGCATYKANRHFKLGRGYYIGGKYEEATKELEEAVKLGSKDTARAKIYLAICYEEIRKERKVITEASLKEKIEKDPNNIQAHWQLAFLYKKRDYTGMAAEQFREVVRIDPSVAEAHYQLATCLEKLDKGRKAIESFQKVLEVKPDHAKKSRILTSLNILYYNGGIAYYNERRYEEAKEYFEKALAAKPGDRKSREMLNKLKPHLAPMPEVAPEPTGEAKDYLQKGVDYYNFAQYDSAISSFQKALKLNPEYVEAHLYLAWAYEKRGKKKKAIGEYQKIIQIDPNHLDAHYQLGTYYDSVGKKKKAIAEYEKVLALSPDRKKLKKISPVLYIFYYHQGMKSYSEKRYEEAKKGFQKALQVKPGDPDATEMLSTVKMILEEKGKK